MTPKPRQPGTNKLRLFHFHLSFYFSTHRPQPLFFFTFQQYVVVLFGTHLTLLFFRGLTAQNTKFRIYLSILPSLFKCLQCSKEKSTMAGVGEEDNMVTENTESVTHDIRSLLCSTDRDFLIKNNGDQVSVDSLQGKNLGLYFSASWCGPCRGFTPTLIEVYNVLSARGVFEVVFVSADEGDESFKEYFSKMPWLAVPYADEEKRDSLDSLFQVRGIPHLVILDEAGNVVSDSGVEIIREYGVEGYPFTPARFAELAEIERAKEEAQTLQSVLVSGDLDFVIGKGGNQIPVADLVGKNILLYFSAHWCPPCRGFLPKLIEAYDEIKAKDDAFEVIFISSDKDQASFDEFYAEMPWLALPFGDRRKAFLSRKFKVYGIPMLVALGPTGRTVSKEARNLITQYGADAYPFTEEHLKKIEERFEEMVKGWPEKLKHPLHEHELKLTRRMMYNCDGCSEVGQVWSYYCEECDFDLHPKKCALGEKKEEDTKEESPKGDWFCEGDVCRKA